MTAFTRRAWVACVAGPMAGLALSIALAPLLGPSAGLLATRLALNSAAERAALSPTASPASNPRDVLVALDEDPLLRASEAVYDAARLRRPAAAGRFSPLIEVAATPHAQIVQAVARVDAILAARLDPPLRFAPLPRRRDLQAAIGDAAATTGVDAAFLIRTAALESGLNPYARAPTSTGRGLFQFVDQTWLQSVARWGGRYGHGAEAGQIQFDARGHAYVVDTAAQRKILDLRYEPALAAHLAAEMAADNAASLHAMLGRSPSAGELYAAHLLGAAGAVRLIRAAYVRPAYPASSLLPEAAAANHRLFYRAGTPLSVSELLTGFP